MTANKQLDSQKVSQEFAFRFILAFWLLLGLIDLLKNVVGTLNAGRAVAWADTLQFVTLYSGVWIVLSYPIYRLFQRTCGKSWLARLATQAGGSLLFGCVHTLLLSCSYSLLVYLSGSFETSFIEFYLPRIFGRFFPVWLNSALAYWVVVIILFAFDYYEQFRRQSTLALQLESELSQAQLQALRMQVQPHFLFNAHNTIAMLIRRKQYDQAVNMISGLSDLLRTTLTRENHQFITVDEEVAIINKYLAIEKARFEDTLSVAIDVASEVGDALVPNLILQPLVENAIKHGVARALAGAALRISAKKRDGKLVLGIHNSGPGLTESGASTRPGGIGLQNVRNRLQKLFGDEHRLSLANTDGGVLAQMEIPFLTGEQGGE